MAEQSGVLAAGPLQRTAAEGGLGPVADLAEIDADRGEGGGVDGVAAQGGEHRRRGVQRDTGGVQDCRAQVVGLGEDPEEQVTVADLVVAQQSGVLLGGNDNGTGSRGE